MLYKEVQALNDAVMDLIETISQTTDENELAILSNKLNTIAAARDEMQEQRYEMLCKARQSCLAEIEALEAEVKRLTKRITTNKNAIDFYENQLLEGVKEKGGKFNAGTFIVGTRKSTSVIVDEELFHDERFQTYQEIRKIDKMGIKAALKNGEQINGAELLEKESISIR